MFATRRFPAQWYDGFTPTPRSVTVWADAEGLHLQSESGPVTHWTAAQWRLVRGGPREPLQLELQGERIEALVVPDPAFLAEWSTVDARAPRARVGARFPVWAWLLAIVLGLTLGGLALQRWIIPSLADAAASHVPLALEREYGAGALDRMVPVAQRLTTPAVVVPVRAIHERLTASAGLTDVPAAIVWRNAEPNAFAVPGGAVVVTTGLLALLESPDQLAAVVAHEVGHVQRRHVVRGLLQRASLGLLVSLAAGDAGVGSTVLRTAGELGGLAYSREHEREADDAALTLLAAHGTGAESLTSALERLRASRGRGGEPPALLSTHPATDARIARIAQRRVAVRGSADWGTPESWRGLRAALPPAPSGAGKGR